MWGCEEKEVGISREGTYTVGNIPLGTTLSFEPAEVPFTSKGMLKRNDKKVHFSLGPECWEFIRKRILIEKWYYQVESWAVCPRSSGNLGGGKEKSWMKFVYSTVFLSLLPVLILEIRVV